SESNRGGEIFRRPEKNKRLRDGPTATAVRESGARSAPAHTLPSRNHTACPPIPHFARKSSAAVGGLDGLKYGVNCSSNHSKYVCSHTWLTTWLATTVSTLLARSPDMRGHQPEFDVNRVALMATARRSLSTTSSIRRRRYCQPRATAPASSGVTSSSLPP